MSVDTSLISLVVSKPTKLKELQRAGVTAEYFVDEYAKVWRWILRNKREYGRIPSPDVVQARYSDLEIHRVRDRDVPMLVSEIQKRKTYMDFLDAIEEASREVVTPDDIEMAMAHLQAKINQFAVRTGKSAIVDLFGKEAQERILSDLRKRRRGEVRGIPTGFKRFDAVVGGLHRKRLVVIMGRPGLGKSWLDLIWCASAVINGYKVVLFPLEMTLEDTAFRLYTIFSAKMFGARKAIKNLDISQGHISVKKIARLTSMLEDRFAGQLLVADIGTLSDSYTMERIEAEIQMHGPDLGWIDYLGLVKGPAGKEGVEDHTTIKSLSNGARRIAASNDCCMGISAQVNREAIKGGHFLPRLEHIAGGDDLGRDANQVVSINRKGEYLFYALVKNREGPEIGKTRVLFHVNEGNIVETRDQDDDD